MRWREQRIDRPQTHRLDLRLRNKPPLHVEALWKRKQSLLAISSEIKMWWGLLLRVLTCLQSSEKGILKAVALGAPFKRDQHVTLVSADLKAQAFRQKSSRKRRLWQGEAGADLFHGRQKWLCAAGVKLPASLVVLAVQHISEQNGFVHVRPRRDGSAAAAPQV